MAEKKGYISLEENENDQDKEEIKWFLLLVLNESLRIYILPKYVEKS